MGVIAVNKPRRVGKKSIGEDFDTLEWSNVFFVQEKPAQFYSNIRGGKAEGFNMGVERRRKIKCQLTCRTNERLMR